MRQTYILLALIALTCSSSAETTCGDNEVASENPTQCTNDCCPTDSGSKCPNKCCSKACVCGLQSKRAKNGTCISARDCPAITCPVNQHYDSCPNTFCSENCSNAHPTGPRCNLSFFHPGPVVICNPGCRCDDNYWRNSDNDCVEYSKCPPTNTSK